MTITMRRLALLNGWATLYDRLDAYASLPVERHPRAARAGEVFWALFPEGLAFLRLPQPSQCAESERLLRRIDEDGLGAEIDELAGAEFLSEIRVSHEVYCAALGLIDPAAPTAVARRRARRPLAVVAG